MDKSIILLNNIYNTLQDIDVKGEKNCAYIVGICNAIKTYLKEVESDSEKS